MKKYLKIIILSFVCLLLAACSKNKVSFEEDSPKANYEGVAIIKGTYDGDKANKIKVNGEDNDAYISIKGNFVIDYVMKDPTKDETIEIEFFNEEDQSLLKTEIDLQGS